jgi:hypothetical protein
VKTRRIGRLTAMIVEHEPDVGAFYVRVTENSVERTVEVSTFVNVDLDAVAAVVGLELLCLPSAVREDERAVLVGRYPEASKALLAAERLTRLSA